MSRNQASRIRDEHQVDAAFQDDILSGDEGFTSLSPQQEADLARRGQTGDQDALWALAMANHNFVRSVAKRYLRPELELEDLVAEGLLGLVEAAERFDPRHGVKFITYGSWWVKRALLRYLRSFEHAVHVPKYKQHELHEFKRSRSRMSQELGRTPTLDELAIGSGRDVRTLEELTGLLSPTEAIDPSVEGGVADRLRASDDVEDLAIQSEALLRLDAVLTVLSARERHVLEQRFGLHGAEAQPPTPPKEKPP